MGCVCNKDTENETKNEMDRFEEMKNYFEEKNKKEISNNIDDDNKKEIFESSYTNQPDDLINKNNLENQFNSMNENNEKQILKSKKKVLNDNNDNYYNPDKNNEKYLSNNFNNDEENNNLNNNENQMYNNDINSNPLNLENSKNDYSINYKQTVFDILNQVRENPSSYVPVIKDNFQYIFEETKTNSIDNENKNTKKIIFKKKLKVALFRGLPAFNETIDILQNSQPIQPFIYKKELEVPLPKNQDELNDKTFFKSKIEQMKNNGIKIDVFFKDLIKDGEISALLMIVDDSIKNPGIKRQCILNPEYKYIGISNVKIGKQFVAYITFSKE
jgi:hypothetical protein